MWVVLLTLAIGLATFILAGRNTTCDGCEQPDCEDCQNRIW